MHVRIIDVARDNDFSTSKFKAVLVQYILYKFEKVKIKSCLHVYTKMGYYGTTAFFS